MKLKLKLKYKKRSSKLDLKAPKSIPSCEKIKNITLKKLNNIFYLMR